MTDILKMIPEDFGERTPDGELGDLIQIFNEHDFGDPRHDKTIADQIVLLGGAEDEGMRELALQMQFEEQINNIQAVNVFCQRIRQQLPQLIETPYQRNGYDAGDYLAGSDVVQLATRYDLPLLVFRTDTQNTSTDTQTQNHWVLALGMPRETRNGHEVLVYNPMRDNEQVLRVSHWNPNNIDVGPLMATGGYANPLAIEALRNRTYDLSLVLDEELARRPHLAGEKQARRQYDGSNCGPISVFAAAVRYGMKPGENSFKSEGRKLLEKDTGVHFLVREELLR